MVNVNHDTMSLLNQFKVACIYTWINVNHKLTSADSNDQFLF